MSRVRSSEVLYEGLSLRELEEGDWAPTEEGWVSRHMPYSLENNNLLIHPGLVVDGLSVTAAAGVGEIPHHKDEVVGFGY